LKTAPEEGVVRNLTSAFAACAFFEPEPTPDALEQARESVPVTAPATAIVVVIVFVLSASPRRLFDDNNSFRRDPRIALAGLLADRRARGRADARTDHCTLVTSHLASDDRPRRSADSGAHRFVAAFIEIGTGSRQRSQEQRRQRFAWEISHEHPLQSKAWLRV